VRDLRHATLLAKCDLSSFTVGSLQGNSGKTYREADSDEEAWETLAKSRPIFQANP
jgi:hypothetical protein